MVAHINHFILFVIVSIFTILLWCIALSERLNVNLDYMEYQLTLLKTKSQFYQHFMKLTRHSSSKHLF